MENNFQFTQGGKTPSASSLDPVRKNTVTSEYKRKAVSTIFLSFFLLLCSAWFCLPLSTRGKAGGGRVQDVPPLAETEIYNGNCRRLVCAARGLLLPTTSLDQPYLSRPLLSGLLLPPSPCGRGTALLLEVEGSQANICSSAGSAYSTSSSSTHSKHNTAQQNIIKHECFGELCIL